MNIDPEYETEAPRIDTPTIIHVGNYLLCRKKNQGRIITDLKKNRWKRARRELTRQGKPSQGMTKTPRCGQSARHKDVGKKDGRGNGTRMF